MTQSYMHLKIMKIIAIYIYYDDSNYGKYYLFIYVTMHYRVIHMYD